jgi:glycosyltransferase involved in cell wall biosynthesis
MAVRCAGIPVMIETYAIIPTRGRSEVFHTTLQSIVSQVRCVIVIDNNDVPTVVSRNDERIAVIHHQEQPPNLSRMINIGIDEATRRAVDDVWNIVLLNDDVTVPSGWVQLLNHEMRAGSYAAAASTPGRNGVLTCWACMVRGELGLRWDEELRWWYGDNAFDRLCRDNGGVHFVASDLQPIHHHPDKQTYNSVMLSEVAGQDAVVYARKYGEH